ncbi:MAG TPA: helix-turn-helix transcriptional regulator [Pyrinomonadaceae bacterium]|jgi:transcriptional regulator with XRE-family HTH domain|nr:helix-turn-helix transcriptional regulator [Pyrinomonadaceae bacterium]
MGTKSRPRPKRLAEKLLQIRSYLGLSQDELIDLLGMKGDIFSASISQYERAVREPSNIVLLKYARLVKISTDVLIDDEIDLPKKFLK